MRLTFKLTLLASSALLSTPALAQQQPTPPEHYTLDARGVDLVKGTFNTSATDVVIGQPGDGGIAHWRVYTNGGWRDTLAGTIQVSGSTYAATCANPVTCNQPTSTTDARGNVTDYTYNSVHGGLLTMTAPAPTTGAARPQTRIAYAAQTAWYKNNAGALVAASSSVTLPVTLSECSTGSSCTGTVNEVKTSIVYGASGVANNLLPTSVTTGAGNGSLNATTTLTYTPNGDVASVNGPLAGTDDTTTYRYDNARQLVGVISPDPDGAGPMLRRATRTTYNPRGQVTLSEVGTVTGLTDPNWAAFVSLQQQAVTYDALSRPTQQRLQSGSTTHTLTQVSYDAAGRTDCIVTRMNPASFSGPPASACTAATVGTFGPDRITKYGYDEASQLTSTTSGFGVDPITERATYTNNGQPLTLTDGKGNVSTFVYDGHDRLSWLRYPNPSSSGSSTTDYEEYGYDAASNVTSTRTRAGQIFTATYDALNRQTAVNAPAGTPSVTYAYDNLGRMTSASVPGKTTTRVFDALGRLASEAGPLGTMSYQYDLAGRRTRQTWPDAFFVTNSWNLTGDMTAIHQGGTTQIIGYSYDNLGRRTGITGGNGVTSAYGYDGASRLSSLSHDVGGTAADVTFGYTYNPAGQIISKSVSNSAYVYGQGAGSTAYVNNNLNRVTSVGGASVSYDANGNITHDTTRAFTYDAASRLTGTNGGTSTLNYDALGRLDNYVGTNGGRYIYDGVETVGFAPVGSTTLQNRFVRGPGVDEIAVNFPTNGNPTQYWASDERGSLVNLSNGTTGSSTVINTYDEYGVPAPTNLGRLQYTGQLWMPDFGVYHYKARAYQPGLGRFMQTDPLGYQAGANLYGYVGMDPLNLNDPLGLQAATTIDEVIVTGRRTTRVRPAIGTGNNMPNFRERYERATPEEKKAMLREACNSPLFQRYLNDVSTVTAMNPALQTALVTKNIVRGNNYGSEHGFIVGTRWFSGNITRGNMFTSYNELQLRNAELDKSPLFISNSVLFHTHQSSSSRALGYMSDGDLDWADNRRLFGIRGVMAMNEDGEMHCYEVE